MKKILTASLLLCSLSTFASNDWMIVCNGANAKNQDVRIEDERTDENKVRDFSVTNLETWESLKLRAAAPDNKTRTGITFNDGQRIDIELKYKISIAKLPNEDEYRGDEKNAKFKLVKRKTTSSDSPVVENNLIEVSCYQRTGGE